MFSFETNAITNRKTTLTRNFRINESEIGKAKLRLIKKSTSKILTEPNDKNRAEIRTPRLEEHRQALIANKKKREQNSIGPTCTDFRDLVLINRPNYVGAPPDSPRNQWGPTCTPRPFRAFRRSSYKSLPSIIFSPAKRRLPWFSGPTLSGTLGFIGPGVFTYCEDVALTARNQRRFLGRKGTLEKAQWWSYCNVLKHP